MTRTPSKKFIHEGDYAAEVEVLLIEDEEPGGGWGPYLSLEDVRKLDAVRQALQAGDLKSAALLGRVFKLEPVGP